MSDPQLIREAAAPEQLESHARAEMLEVAAELRRVEGKLADLLAALPDPPTVLTHRGGSDKRELASAELRPPTLLQAMLGTVELATEQVGQSIGLLRDAAEISEDSRVEQWLEHRGADRRAGLAELVRSMGQQLRAVQ